MSHPAGLSNRLREKLPEILLEAASVVVAVLLALAVDEWRDARAKRELADRAKRSILSELQANRDELNRSYAQNARHLQDLEVTLRTLEANPDSKHAQVQLAFNAAQLSDAAWETTRATQASQLLPFDWVVEMARVYDTQAMYKTTQLDMLQRTRSAIAEFGSAARPADIVAPLRSELLTFQILGEQLRTSYDKALNQTRGDQSAGQ
jgi:hypothetical protein